MADPNRPYPEGFAWDEAWRQRQRADAAKAVLDLGVEIVNKDGGQPHQKRVVDEKRELDEKARKLSDFIGNGPVFPTIDAAEQERLKEQCEIMWQYSEILGKRIAAFK